MTEPSSERRRPRIAVTGMGMVGLPTALLFAEAGFDVAGIDADSSRLAMYRAGRSDRPLEPDVASLLAGLVSAGRISFSAVPIAADVHVIAVGTPVRDGVPDLSALRAAFAAIVPVLRADDLVVIESTVPPGTTRQLALEHGIPAGVLLGHAPERVAPGNTLAEMRDNPRVVGGDTPEAGNAIARLYESICRAPIEVVDVMTAEFTKLIENTYRDVNIALANELALMANDLGVDVWKAIELANAHPRVHIHRPGPGVGGHCIGVAPLFLRAAAPERFELLAAARHRNTAMPGIVADIVMDAVRGRSEPRVALLGLAYKPDVADDRDSPSLAVASELRRRGADPVVHDPLLLADVPLASVVRGAHCVVFLVAHSAYREITPGTLVPLVADRRVVDAIHMTDRAAWEAAGFEVRVLGQRTAERAAI